MLNDDIPQILMRPESLTVEDGNNKYSSDTREIASKISNQMLPAFIKNSTDIVNQHPDLIQFECYIITSIFPSSSAL